MFEKKTVTVYSQEDDALLRGWRDPRGSRLWLFALCPKGHTTLPTASPTGPVAMNAHDLPSVCALVHYLHACTGFQVCSMWLAATKAGNFASCPGLTYTNVEKYCPVYVDTLKGRLTQTRQGARSTKPKPATEDALPDITNQLPTAKSKEFYVYMDPISKMYTDDMGRFPVRSRSVNHYIILAYHVDTNTILVVPFQSRQDRHCIAAYNRIMTRLKNRGQTVDLQILDTEARKAYKLNIQDMWGCTFQLLPPHAH